MAVRAYQDLIVWQKAMDFVEAVYKVTRQFTKEELYGLPNQLRRAAVSIPSNIAEGQGRGAGAEFRYHVRIAQGSVQEAETQILIAERLDLVPPRERDLLLDRAAEVGRLNRGLAKAIRG